MRNIDQDESFRFFQHQSYNGQHTWASVLSLYICAHTHLTASSSSLNRRLIEVSPVPSFSLFLLASHAELHTHQIATRKPQHIFHNHTHICIRFNILWNIYMLHIYSINGFRYIWVLGAKTSPKRNTKTISITIQIYNTLGL